MERITVRKNRGFKLSQKLIHFFKWVTQKGAAFESKTKLKTKISTKLGKCGKSIQHGLFNLGNQGYIRVGHDPEIDIDIEPEKVPKGHLAVYVGVKENETRRVLIPVLFLNHPLFGKLLKETEDVYGFNHPGRIRIPCLLSEFKRVLRKIAAGEKRRSWIYRPGYSSGVDYL